MLIKALVLKKVCRPEIHFLGKFGPKTQNC